MNKPHRIRLGVNIDHIATLRQQRGTDYPDVVRAAHVVEDAGADLITVHLREDRRHIQDSDVRRIRGETKLPLNLEMALTGEMLAFALDVRPDWVCLVPERRQELTTEGGLDAAAQTGALAGARDRLQRAGIRLSLFIDAEEHQVAAAAAVGADAIELHTGSYANATGREQARELQRLQQAAGQAAAAGLGVHAGHGLHRGNVGPVAAIPAVEELNIGHALVSEAVFVGLGQAIAAMRGAIDQVRND